MHEINGLLAAGSCHYSFRRWQLNMFGSAIYKTYLQILVDISYNRGINLVVVCIQE